MRRRTRADNWKVCDSAHFANTYRRPYSELKTVLGCILFEPNTGRRQFAQYDVVRLFSDTYLLPHMHVVMLSARNALRKWIPIQLQISIDFSWREINIDLRSFSYVTMCHPSDNNIDLHRFDRRSSTLLNRVSNRAAFLCRKVEVVAPGNA